MTRPVLGCDLALRHGAAVLVSSHRILGAWQFTDRKREVAVLSSQGVRVCRILPPSGEGGRPAHLASVMRWLQDLANDLKVLPIAPMVVLEGVKFLHGTSAQAAGSMFMASGLAQAVLAQAFPASLRVTPPDTISLRLHGGRRFSKKKGEDIKEATSLAARSRWGTSWHGDHYGDLTDAEVLARLELEP